MCWEVKIGWQKRLVKYEFQLVATQWGWIRFLKDFAGVLRLP